MQNDYKNPDPERPLAPCDWRTFMHLDNAESPEKLASVEAALTAHFERFVQPEIVPDPTRTDPGRVLISVTCPGCGRSLIPDLGKQLVSDTIGFRWGLVHGWGHCGNCGWPAAAHHFIREEGAEEDCITLRNFVLAVHPNFVQRKEGSA